MDLCEFCGVPLRVVQDGALTTREHPGGVCSLLPVLGVDEHKLTFEEFKALIRVARAQIEMDKRRASNQ